MIPQDVIRRKRDGGELGPEEIRDFVEGVVSGAWTRGQTGSMLMAIFQRGMNLEETRLLLQEMLDSGQLLKMDAVPGPKADKHSTGGVGDKVSLVLAPLAAACGLAVPMLSGRGLGHTGGTLDKLEAIPGFNVFLDRRRISRQVAELGCVIAGQTENIAPADKILYALRDETATVEHSSLIAASILSKKLAEGIDCLLLDVKFGRGAFLREQESAEQLARLMVDLGRAAGCKVAAWLTDMDQPLGRAVGNAVEVEECIAILKDDGPDEITDFICRLVAGMLELSGVAEDFESALELSRQRLQDGTALEKFRLMIAAQDGNPDVVDNPSLLPRSRHRDEILYEEAKAAYVVDVDARAIAGIVLETGAGRRNADESIDPGAGISGLACAGDLLEPGQVMARIHHDDPDRVGEWEERLRKAFTLSPEPPVLKERIRRKIT